MKEKIEHLKFIIDRYDTYIESTQSKSNMYLALNTAILGGIITLLTASGLTGISPAVIAILGVAALLSLVSLVITLWAITPYLKSASDKNNSVIFFQEVADSKYEHYHDRVDDISEKKLFGDLTCQAYSLATGLKKKYQKLMYAGRITIISFSLLFVCIILFITQSF
jgi:hypothetical protein